MSARKVAVWTGAFGALALVLFVVGTVLDLRVSDAFYLGRNAFADMYEAIGKMPAFVLLAIAGGIGGEFRDREQFADAAEPVDSVCDHPGSQQTVGNRPGETDGVLDIRPVGRTTVTVEYPRRDHHKLPGLWL